MTTAPPLLEATAHTGANVVGETFADIVFDRPLDHAYTYAVPDALRQAIGVGKRIEAPFGRGDRRTVGYCVRVHESAPERAVKVLEPRQELTRKQVAALKQLRQTGGPMEQRRLAALAKCGIGPVAALV